MKRHSGWSLFIGLLVIVGLIGVAAAQQPKPGGTLRVAWEADLTGLDPHVSPGIQSWYVVGNLFNSLLTIDAELNYIPDLAESWDMLQNGKVYVFHLRKGVKFHDGTDFDAEVVRWNYQRIMDPEEKAFDAPYYSIVETVEALDSHTVKFTLKHPSATLLPVVAAERTGFLQMSPASYKQWGKEDVRLHPAGTEEAFLQAGYDFQRYIAENMMATGVASVPFLQAARTDVQGYVHLHGYKIRFETTWLDKP